MQVIDNYFGITGYNGTGPWYYAIRVNVDPAVTHGIQYANAQEYSIQLT
jgi:hypothetical protein